MQQTMSPNTEEITIAHIAVKDIITLLHDQPPKQHRVGCFQAA